MSNKCILCGGYKQQRFWLCKSCAIKYGAYRKPYKEWPRWIKEFIKYARILETKDKKFAQSTISMDQTILEKIIDTQGEIIC